VVPDPKPQGRPVERRPDPRGADERRSGGLPAEEGRVARLSQRDRAEQDRAEQDRAEQDRAEQGRSEDRRRLRAGAERGVAVATKKLARARDTERSKAERLEELQARIDEARRALDEARFEVRRSQGELAEAEQELADLAD
jgi:chromosome segregation ATPase